MFQFKPELLEIIQKYQNLIKNTQFTESLTIARYATGAVITIGAFAILCSLLNLVVFKKNENLGNFLDKATIYLMIIGLIPVIVGAINWHQVDKIPNQIANSVIQEYNLKRESNNPLKKFDEIWLKGRLTNHEIKNSTLFKPKHVCVCRGKANPLSVKYMQIEPAPEGDAPVVETKVITKNEMTTHNSNHIQPSDIQLIKIEKKDNTTLITTHIKINNQWYKTQLQESLLDLMLEGKTQPYYDDAQGKMEITN